MDTFRNRFHISAAKVVIIMDINKFFSKKMFYLINSLFYIITLSFRDLAESRIHLFAFFL